MTKNSLITKLSLENYDDDQQTNIELFYENPDIYNFRAIGKSNQTKKIVKYAIKSIEERSVLKYVAKKFITEELCREAVKRNGYNLSDVPDSYKDVEMYTDAIKSGYYYAGDFPKQFWTELSIDELKKLYNSAAKNNPLAISYIPTKFLNVKMIQRAVERTDKEFHFLGNPIKYVPKEYLTSDLIDQSIRLNPSSVFDIPNEYCSMNMYLDALKGDERLIKRFPDEIINNQKFKKEASKISLNIKKYLNLIEKSKAEYNSNKVLIKTRSKELSIPESNHSLVKYTNKVVIHNLVSENVSGRENVYYVSDIHLEHQLDLYNINENEVRKKVYRKVHQLVRSVPNNTGILLIAGDVADDIRLVRIFYELLNAEWDGKIVAILGNHELWSRNETGSFVDADTLIEEYKTILTKNYVAFLENEVYLIYKGDVYKHAIVSEDILIHANDIELKELFSKSSFLVLGGIGFSGLNINFNAKRGIYRDAISTNEDKKRSLRFNMIYEKILKCASDEQVIVLTHTPMQDWSNNAYNPKWIYINGHTHNNCIIRKDDGTTVLSDNQIGYKPKKWHLNSFTRAGFYDPFKDMKDGIFQITRSQYFEFNDGHSIDVQSLKTNGKIYVIKKNNTYMFFLKNKKLYILEGGHIHTAEHEITYYFDNLDIYQKTLQKAFEPYENILDKISAEVKAIGGSGTKHGCIVDLDFYNHIYLNISDGTLTFYYSPYVGEQQVFPNLPSLLEESPLKPISETGVTLLKNYRKAKNENSLPFLSNVSTKIKLIGKQQAQLAFGTRIYAPSRTMRMVQYIFDQNIVRNWNDNVLGSSLNTSNNISKNRSKRIGKIK